MARQVFCCALLLMILFAATADAVEVVNKLSFKITVFAPPKCQPCYCPLIVCIRAPCIQNCPCPESPCQAGQRCPPRDCFCIKECRFVPGVKIKPGSSATVAPDEKYPLAYLTVVLKGVEFNVKAADLKRITRITTVVVTAKACGRTGIVARVYPNPKFAGYKSICLVRGKRYGS